MSSPPSAQSLLWVKSEIESNLDLAEKAWQRYVEEDRGGEALARTMALVREVRGVLQAIELDGGALFAAEIERTLKAVERDGPEARDGALEALTRAILQIPLYLERVAGTLHENPLVLLPLLNELRTARGEDPFDEAGLKRALLMQRRSATAHGPRSDPAALARGLRPRYQTLLLKVYQNPQDRDALSAMLGVAAQVEEVVNDTASFELWWAAGAFLEALHDGGLALTTSRKQILGRLDGALRHLGAGAERNDDELRRLRDVMLAELREATSHGGRVQAVRETYRAPQGDEGWSASTADLSSPSYAALRTVGGAVHDDLRLVKTRLDIYQRQPPEERRGEDLAPLAVTLRKSASTLQVLGLGSLHEDLKRQAETLERCAVSPLDNENLFEVAATLLKVEDGLDEEIERLTHARSLRQAGMPEPEVLLNQARAAAVREILVNLARVRNELAQVSPRGGELPASLDPHLASSVSVLRFLGHGSAATLMERLRRVVAPDVWRGIAALPQAPDLFARLADALVSLEYWLEMLRQQRAGAEGMLENAETCLRALESAAARAAERTTRGVPAAPKDVSAPSPVAPTAHEGEPLRDAPAGPAEGPSVTPKPLPAPAASPAVEARPATATRPAAAPRRPVRPVPTRESAAALPVFRGEPDPELLDIFRDEVREMAAQAGQALEVWRGQLADHASATTVRRAFHTLKGSGRLVGTERLSEFSWAVENLLNRVLDGTRAADDRLVDFVATAVGLLPRFLEELETGAPVVEDLGSLVEQANGFLQTLPAAAEALAPSPSSAVPGLLPPPVPRLEPDLYRIFLEEITGHLRVLREWLPHAAGSLPPEAVLRATHTVSGSSHMAEAGELAALAESLDHYLWGLSRLGRPFDPSLLPALEETLARADTLLADYGDRRREPADPAPLVAVWSEAYGSLTAAEAVTGVAGTARETPLSGAPAVEEATAASADLPPVQGAPPSGPAAEDSRPDASPADGAATAGIDAELAAIFYEEGQTLLDHAQQAWSEFAARPRQGGDALAAVRRDLHTLKGSARIAGFLAFGDLAHELETLLEHVEPTEMAEPDRRRVDDLARQTLGALGRMLLESRAGRPPSSPRELLAAIASFLHAPVPARDAEETPAAEPATEEPSAGEPRESTPAPAGERAREEGARAETEGDTEFFPAAAEALTARAPAGRTVAAQVRISAEALDQALNYAGEISIYRARLDEQMSTIGFNLLELRRTVDRLRDQLRRLELETEAQMLSRLPQEVSSSQTGFDPLELDRYTRVQEITRALAESVNDVASLEQLLHNLAQESETLLVQQGRVTTLVQDGLMRSRLVPIFSLEARLRRAVQQTAAEQGKRAVLALSGTEAEIDRRLLERIVAPLEHMVRNAVAHGLEAPAERRRLGKDETGVVRCEFHREGSEVLIEVRDDGRGLDYDAIRRRAESLGLVSPGQKLGEADLLAFIFRPGFSTAASVTQSAGRGIGMDIVASEIRDLAGTLDIESRPGQGTAVRIRLPFTLAITQALLVTAHGYSFAVPLTSIEGVARLPRREYELAREKPSPTCRYGGREYRLETLAGLMLGESGWQPPDAPTVPLLLVRAGQELAALAVDAIQGNREIVVKPVGAQVASIAGISGATILGDGSIVLILDGAGLVRAARRVSAVASPAEESAPRRALVLVVDDSITMRRVSQRLLERHGLEVLTAKDGVDALALLAERVPDAALVDIEMPRMDGFELTGHMRRDERLREVPVVMITSRSGEKHREHARSVGVNAYLSKPYQEEELLDTLGRLVPRLVHLRQGRPS